MRFIDEHMDGSMRIATTGIKPDTEIEIYGSHGGEYEGGCLLGCCAA
jgi:hypothetical protein